MQTNAATIHEIGSKDGWHGKIEANGHFPPELDRYHLYIVRHLCGLTEAIPASVVKPYPKGDAQGWPGWQFPDPPDSYAGSTSDRIFSSRYLHEVYFRADKDYAGRYSVPLLWDVKAGTAVCNESAEILRWLPAAFGKEVLTNQDINLYPLHLRKDIDYITPWMSAHLNEGVYKTGFAPDQETYDRNVVRVFAALNKLELIVKHHGGPFVLGSEMTELDIRLYATLIRFDPVYVQHFKCNLGTIRHDYPVLNNWLKGLYWNHAAFRDTTDFRHIKENYTKSHGDINPKAITPMGPIPDIETGFERDWSKLDTGRIELQSVTEYESKL